MKKYLLFFISLLCVLCVNLYFRSFPITLPQLKRLAQDAVEGDLYKQLSETLEKKYPGMDEVAQGKLIEVEVSRYKQAYKSQIALRVRDEFKKLKDKYQDDRGQTYLLELDGWHWSRYVENVVRLGRVGDTLKDGQDMDMLMLAPNGSPIKWNKFFFYLSAALYRIFSFFRPVPLDVFLFYLPLLLASVFIIVLFLFSFSIAGYPCAIISCLYVGLSPLFIERSCAGWFDTDVLNMLFPILIAWPYLQAHRSSGLGKRVAWICISGFMAGLFSFTWHYWWFFCALIIIYELYSFLNLFLERWQHKEENSDALVTHSVSLGSFILLSFFWMFVFSGLEPLRLLFWQVKNAVTLNKALTGDVWPNVYSTVSELAKVDYYHIGRYLGGVPVFLASFGSLLALFLHSARAPEFSGWKNETITLLTLWAISMFFACSQGVRFAIFLLLPLGIALGWMAHEAFAYFKNRKKIVLGLFAAAVAFVLMLCNKASRDASSIFPLMTDSWHKVLVELRNDTPKDATINSWWDFGDWFEAVGRRRAIFDGHSQDQPQAYWMAHVFMAEDEEEAVATLRMLNNGGNHAYEVIDAHLKDSFKSALLLKKVLTQKTPQQATGVLRRFLTPKVTQSVVDLVFKKPGKAYFVVDYSMPDKVRAISFLGNWDFAKVYLAANSKKRTKDEVLAYLTGAGMDAQEVRRLAGEAALVSGEDTTQWVSRTLRFYGDLTDGHSDNKGLILFDNGLVYNPAQQSVYLYSPREAKYKMPKSLFILEDNAYREIPYANSDLYFSALIIKHGDEYKAIVLDTKLGKSLLVRLYFLNGAGLAHFVPFIDEKSGNEYLRVFEIKWE